MAGRSKRLLFVGQMVVTVAALAVLFWNIDRRRLFVVLGGAELGWLAAALLLAIGSTVLATVKIRMLVSIAGFSRSLRRCWLAVLRGVAMNVVLPARGGDIAKMFYLRDREEPIGPLIAAGLVERAIDVTSLATLAFVASMYAHWPTGAWIASFVISLAIIGIAVFATSKAWNVIPNAFRGTIAAMRDILIDPRTALGAYPLALLTWTINAAILWVLMRSVGVAVSGAMAAAAAPVAILLGMVPISVGGMGTREAALVWLLAESGDTEAVFAAGFLYSVYAFWLIGLFGIAVSGWESVRGGVKSADGSRPGEAQ